MNLFSHLQHWSRLCYTFYCSYQINRKKKKEGKRKLQFLLPKKNWSMVVRHQKVLRKYQEKIKNIKQEKKSISLMPLSNKLSCGENSHGKS